MVELQGQGDDLAVVAGVYVVLQRLVLLDAAGLGGGEALEGGGGGVGPEGDGGVGGAGDERVGLLCLC